VATQTLFRLVQTEQEEEGGSFGPDEISVMTTAFDQIVRDLNLKDREDPVVEMIAKLVIELVRNRERDPEALRQHVLGKYRPPS
jgi:hypothetical protein